MLRVVSRYVDSTAAICMIIHYHTHMPDTHTHTELLQDPQNLAHSLN